MTPSSEAPSQDGGIDGTSAAEAGAACVPGMSVSCVGPGACSGYQVCDSTGSGFGPCDCATEAGSDSASPSREAGMDAGEEASGPALDAGMDATEEASNPSPEAGMDATEEAPSPPGMDAGMDASDSAPPLPEAGMDGGEEASNPPGMDAATDGSDSSSPSPEAGMDATEEASSPPGMDAGADGSDSGPPLPEAGMDATVDSSSPPGMDASGEASSPPMDGGSVDATVDSGGGVAVVSGAVEKGPFVLGSTVTLSAIDGTGVPTGQVFNTQTTSDLGDFSVSFAYRGNVDIQAQGFYYDEVSGMLSGASIVLRALAQVSSGGAQSAHINLITHLAHGRALALLGDGGMSLPAAEAQAEAELVAALGIGGAGFQPGGVGVNLGEVGTDNDSNAYLLAVSAVLLKAAHEQAGDGGSVDSQFQQLMNTISADLAGGGSLPSGIVSELRTAEQDLDIDFTMDAFTARLQASGTTGPVADLNRGIDSDGDGYRNRIDTCPLVANPTQSMIPPSAVCWVQRHQTFVPSQNAYVTIPGDFLGTGYPGVLELWQATSGFASTLLSGDGSGRFSVVTASGMPFAYPMTGTAADVDKDGHLDVVATSTNQGAGWYRGDGTGNFAPIQYFSGGAASYNSYNEFVMADFNGDTFNDVVRWSSGSPTQLVVTLGTGPGKFAAPVLESFPTLVGVNGFAATDANGDGKLDIAAVGVTTVMYPMGAVQVGSAFVFLGDGKGGFTLGATSNLPAGALTPNDAQFGDFNGDGVLDAAAFFNNGVGTGAGSVNLRLALGTGQGSFGAFAASIPWAVWQEPAFAPADFTGDGKTDFVTVLSNGAQTGPQLSLLISEGVVSGSVAFAVQPLRSGPERGNGSAPYVSVADLNHDGTPDIIDALTTPLSKFAAEGILVNPASKGVWK